MFRDGCRDEQVLVAGSATDRRVYDALTDGADVDRPVMVNAGFDSPPAPPNCNSGSCDI